VLGTAPLAGGSASFTTSSLPLGTQAITAVYSGDQNFVTGSSATLAETVLDFGLSPVGSAGATATVIPGSAAGYQLAITPTSGRTFPVAAVLGISGLPQGAALTLNTTAWTQLTATQWQVPANTTLNNLSLTITVPHETATTQTASFGNRIPGLALGILLLPFARRLRRGAKRLRGRLGVVILLAVGAAASLGLGGCGSGNGFFGQAPETYTITATVTAGAVSHSTDLTLNVQ
jgi:trimeric autotransporter adhesin